MPSVVVGGLVLAAVLVGDRLLPGIPVALVALVASLVATGGPRPAGARGPGAGAGAVGPAADRFPFVSFDEAVALLPGAIGIAILSFADTSLTGRNFADRHGEVTDPNRELLALGAADLGASLTSGYPISSSASRTAALEVLGSHHADGRRHRRRVPWRSCSSSSRASSRTCRSRRSGPWS